MKTFEKISDGLDSMIEKIIVVMIIIMILGTGTNIVLRWTIGRSIGELDEVALMAFVWVVYTGIGKLYRMNAHIRMDFIINRLPRVPRRILELIDAIINAAACTAMAYLACTIMINSMNRTLNVTHVPYSFMHLSLLIGFAVMTAYIYADVIKIFLNLFRKTGCSEGGKE